MCTTELRSLVSSLEYLVSNGRQVLLGGIRLGGSAISMKYLQHTYKTSEILETYACNMHFQAQRLLVAWTKWRLVVAELDTYAELDAAEWRGVMPAGRQLYGPDDWLCSSNDRARGCSPPRRGAPWGGGGSAACGERMRCLRDYGEAPLRWRW